MESVKQYEHIAFEQVINLRVTKEQAAAIFKAYDYGLGAVDKIDLEHIERLINEIKYELWP